MSLHSKVVFKDYTPKQMILLPPSLEELIESNHPVFTVNEVIDRIDISSLKLSYKGGGTSSYHPRMLLKVLIYAYLSNIYSSRKIESALNENIHFMWLSGMSRVDHNTINRFRGDRLKGSLKQIFSQVVLLLAEEGHVNIKSIYTDGTKIEANANRYTFVWGRAIEKSKQRMEDQLEKIWRYTQKVAKAEMQDTEEVNFDQIDKEKLQAAITRIDQALKDKPVDKKVKQKINYIKKNWSDKLDEYEKKLQILGNRNSYSKTDKDATFMRMKEDHMQNGQLKPAYNWQFSTSDQFIINYSIHQQTTDTNTFIPHLLEYENLYQSMPDEVTADSGYGSQENYEFLEDNQIDGYVKYNYFHKEQEKKNKVPDPFNSKNFYYDKEQDCYYCPMGQPMHNIGQSERKTASGFVQKSIKYQAINCRGCPLRCLCHRSQNNRIIEVNHKLNQLKQRARERLTSQKGLDHRSKRPCDVEAVFGMIKQNKNYRRSMLRGVEKVEIEAGLLAIAHNMAKMVA